MRVGLYCALPLIKFDKKRPGDRILVFGFFVRSGYVRIVYDFKDASLSGNYWSPRRTNKFNVELLVYYEAIGVSPSAARGAVAGYPLRCLAI